jgi:O-antigen/teichoic acid export membrane protein
MRTPTEAGQGVAPVALLSRVSGYLNEPLLRNGYALVLNAGTTALLGMVFWLVAARTYPSPVVGVGAATIAAMTTLSTVAQLNLASVLSRFLPVAGSASTRLVRRSYAATALVAAVAGTVFVVGTPWWSPSLSFLAEDLALAVWFVTALVLWCLYAVQDGALSGLRHSTWVLGKNTVYAAAKVVCLLVPAVALTDQGIWLAWTLPVAPVLVAVNLVMFRRLMPHRPPPAGHEQPAPGRAVVRFAAADYVVALAATGLTGVLPIIVLEGVGAAEAAYFALAFSIAYAVYMVSRSMATSLLVEGATDPRNLARVSYRATVHTAALLVPVVGALFVAAPWVLGLFGTEYAAEGSTTLRLLVLAVLPSSVVVVYMAVARVRRHMASLVVVTLAINVGALVAILLVLGPYGLTGVAAAWLAVQTCAATVLLARVLGPLWAPALGPRAGAVVLPPARLVRRLLHGSGQRRYLTGRYPAVARTAGLDPAWRVQRVLSTVGDVAVALVGGTRPEAVLKLSRSVQGDAALDRAVSATDALSDDPRLATWSRVLPVTRARVRLEDGRLAVLESIVPGVSGRVGLEGTGSRTVEAVLPVIDDLHHLTGHRVAVDDTLLGRWLDEPACALMRLADPADTAAVRSLATAVRSGLRGRTVTVAWSHGDLCPGNVLLDPDDGSVRGLLDWERASPDFLPDVDRRHLELTTRSEALHRELGELVLDDLAAAAPDDPDTVVTLLTWLHHVSGICEKTGRYPPGSLWWARNVSPVLRWVEESGR